MLSLIALLFAGQDPPIGPPTAVPAPPSPPRTGADRTPPMSDHGPPRRARPHTPIDSLIADADYPAEARRAGRQGSVGFRLVVGPDGRVIDCVVTSSSGSAALDEATCPIVRARARFDPAIGYAGPTSDTVYSRVTWRLIRPRSAQSPPARQ